MSEKRKRKEKSAGLSNNRQNYPKFGKSDPNPLATRGKGLVKVRNPLGHNWFWYTNIKKLKKLTLSNKDQEKVSVDRELHF